jgi:hypothetical protein
MGMSDVRRTSAFTQSQLLAAESLKNSAAVRQVQQEFGKARTIADATQASLDAVRRRFAWTRPRSNSGANAAPSEALRAK